jgi:hypothetical protein
MASKREITEGPLTGRERITPLDNEGMAELFDLLPKHRGDPRKMIRGWSATCWSELLAKVPRVEYGVRLGMLLGARPERG